MKKTALMLHSQLLYPEIWERVMIGDPRQGVLGVYSKGMELAMSEDTDVVLLGAGLPILDGHPTLTASRAYIQGRIADLVRGFRPGLEVIVDHDSHKTADEVEFAAKALASRGVERVISVTPPKHAPRVLRDFLALQDKGAFRDMEIAAIPSMVDLPGALPADVCILEPFHRPDLHSYPLHLYGAGMVEAMKLGNAKLTRDFFEDLERLFQSYGVEPRWKEVPKPKAMLVT
jgi:hypothetical protein